MRQSTTQFRIPSRRTLAVRRTLAPRPGSVRQNVATSRTRLPQLSCGSDWQLALVTTPTLGGYRYRASDGDEAAHARRGTPHRRQHRQAAGAHGSAGLEIELAHRQFLGAAAEPDSQHLAKVRLVCGFCEKRQR